MKQFFKNHGKKILELLALLAIVFVLSVVIALILYAVGIIGFDDGITINREFFDKQQGAPYGTLVILGIQIAVTTLLCFIPGVSMAFIVLIQALYEESWRAFLVAFTGAMLSSLIMYLLGRYGGYNLCKKIVGEKDCEKATELLNTKGVVYFPLMMMFPAFPDDALVMMAGTLRMSLVWFLPSVIIGRGVGIATIVFGLDIIPFEYFTAWWHWAIFVAVCAVVLVAVLFLATKLSKYLEKRNKKDT